VWAIPPGSQINTIESALGLSLGTADAMLGNAAVTPATAAALRNSRRFMAISLSDVLKFRRTNQRPKQIARHFLARPIRFHILLRHRSFLLRRHTIERC